MKKGNVQKEFSGFRRSFLLGRRWLFFLIYPVLAFSQLTDYPPVETREDMFYDQEIIRLSKQRAGFQEKAKQEPDAKKRSRIEEAILKTTEVIANLNQERKARTPQVKKEVNTAGQELRLALQDVLNEIEEADKQPDSESPQPTPTPSPETYETEQGFKIRLRFPE